jgi:N-acetylglutamate synthase-like GNAT family acetyltransferase
VTADDDAHVIVVEDDGRLVGCVSLVRMWHAEGIWITPALRTKGTVLRRLLDAMKTTAKDLDARSFSQPRRS